MITDVIVFPKKCACCGHVLTRVRKLSGSWWECRNRQCLVWLLNLEEEA